MTLGIERPPTRVSVGTVVSNATEFFTNPILGVLNEKWVYAFEMGDSDIDSCVVVDGGGRKHVMGVGAPLQGPFPGPFTFRPINGLIVNYSTNAPAPNQPTGYAPRGVRCYLEVLAHYKPIVHTQSKRPKISVDWPNAIVPGVTFDGERFYQSFTISSYLTVANAALCRLPVLGRKRAQIVIHNSASAVDSIIVKIEGAQFDRSALNNAGLFSFPIDSFSETTLAPGTYVETSVNNISYGQIIVFYKAQTGGVGNTGLLQVHMDAFDE